MIGKQFKLFGTDNILEITGEQGDYWIITIRSADEEELGVLISKQDLIDSENQGTLIKK